MGRFEESSGRWSRTWSPDDDGLVSPRDTRTLKRKPKRRSYRFARTQKDFKDRPQIRGVSRDLPFPDLRKGPWKDIGVRLTGSPRE